MKPVLEIVHVDAFTDAPFAGNPAAVCLLPEPREEVWMQQVAGGMNLSETAFLHRRANGDYDLRWFTPSVEVALCGHATLASAHVLWEQGLLDRSNPARFHTRSGLLMARSRDGWVELDFPTQAASSVDTPAGLLEALGLDSAPRYVGRNSTDYLIEVESESAVRELKPDFRRLVLLAMRGVIVTAEGASDTDFDFVSRFFAPGAGIDEDPVTGSAHCCLGPHWTERLGRNPLTAYQVSSRGGVVRVHVEGDRVILGGQAVTIFSASLRA